jgi:protein SCO1/2
MRRFPVLLRLLALIVLASLAACSHRKLARDDIGIAGMVPPLTFTMTDAHTGRLVTAGTFRGKVVLLFFGYTNCTDECPFTVARVGQILHTLGPLADRAVFLFATVDPRRDTLPVLRRYLAAFGPDMIGLRGNPNQLFRLARRYRVVFSVHPSKNPAHYTVTHSAAVYVFGPDGQAQFMLAKLGEGAHPDLKGRARDLRHLILHPPRRSVLQRIAALG